MTLKTCIIGSGNWGSAVARIVGRNAQRYPDTFANKVVMWVFEEIIGGKKLSDIINETHENVKYLPDMQLPVNVEANPDLVESVKGADILVFVVPHQFIDRICQNCAGYIKPSAMAVSLIKGLSVTEERCGLKRFSEIITEVLKIDCNVLMGPNLANEVASGKFCEATIGAGKLEHQRILEKLFQTKNFRISCVPDVATVELCGALKNIVACAAGFVDGLELGNNSKMCIIRLGFMEMTYFVEYFYPDSLLATFLEACGIGDLITTCFGGRNRKVCEAFVRTGKDLNVLEAELLGGQCLQGPHTAEQVFKMTAAAQMQDKYVLMTHRF